MRLSKLVFGATWLIANLAVPINVCAESPPRTVLIINESASDSPFGHRFIAQVYATLDTEKVQRYAVHAEFLDFGHFNGQAYDELQTAYLSGKYRSTPVSVIVALGSESLAFVSRIRSNVWSNIPIVFVIFDDAQAAHAVALPNVTGIVASRRFEDLVKSARALVPDLGQIAVVGEPLERQPLRSHYRQDIRQVAKDLNINNLTGLPLNEIEKRVAILPDNAAIAYLPIYTDGTGATHNPAEALTAIARVAKRPIVVDSEDFIGNGATGGFVLSATELGRAAGQQIARILSGEGASAIPISVRRFTKPVFDERKIKRWDLSEAALPVGSELKFHELNIWGRYRWQISAIVITIPSLCLIIAWLLFERRRRLVAERESHQHLLEVTKMDRAMTASAMSASIGHELNQPLSAILNNAEAAEVLLESTSLDREHLKEILADIQRDDHRAVGIIKHLRMLLRQGGLDPQTIDVSELVSDTVGIVQRYAAEHGVAIQVEPLPGNLQIRADRVHIQQVLLNLAMNAIDAMETSPEGKRKLILRVSQREPDVMISVEDTGTGIPDEKLKSIFMPFVTTKQQGTGLGLSIAQTIVGTYGGRIWAENRPEGGAIFHFTLAIARAEAA
jgi:signal transduction histidine kinase